MIDVHCHLNFHAFARNYDDIIKRAQAKGVHTIINVGTKLDSSQEAVKLAHQYPNLYAIVGIHPHHADKIALGDHWVSELKKIARKEKVVAIGEIGLDYYRYQSNGIVDPVLQKQVFEEQIQLAYELNLPLQIHNRHGGKDVLEILHHHKNILLPVPGMFHCFAGNMDVLRGALDLGFYIGFDGNLTYPGLAPKESVSLSDLAKATPLDRIVTETDSPFLTPIPHRGTKNEPAYVILVGERLAQIKSVSFERLAEQTRLNAQKIFHLSATI